MESLTSTILNLFFDEQYENHKGAHLVKCVIHHISVFTVYLTVKCVYKSSLSVP